jgi:SAM-dependent methyltransferase
MSTETFDADWLALREPVDHRARPDTLLPLLNDWWSARGASEVLDLGSGTGSNLRYLAPKLIGNQSWRLLDHDEDLLARIEAPSPPVSVTPLRGDLAVEGLLEIRTADLVTASALLDLASERWISELVEACSAAGCAALFSLSYDGTIEWSDTQGTHRSDAHGDDELVRSAVNAHQHGDKGLGSALGPDAAAFAASSYQDMGYRTWVRSSPWRLGSDDAELALALIAGWKGAAEEQRPDRVDQIGAWAHRRAGSIIDRTVSLTVGHLDLLALPSESAHR